MTKEEIINILAGAKDWNGDVPFDIAVKAINKMEEVASVVPERKKGQWVEEARYEGDTQPDVVCSLCGVGQDYYGAT